MDLPVSFADFQRHLPRRWALGTRPIAHFLPSRVVVVGPDEAPVGRGQCEFPPIRYSTKMSLLDSGFNTRGNFHSLMFFGATVLRNGRRYLVVISPLGVDVEYLPLGVDIEPFHVSSTMTI